VTSLLFPIGWAVLGAGAGWLARWGSVKLARLEGLEPGFKPWQVYGPPILCALLFGVFAWHLEIGHLLVLMERSAFIAVLVQMIFFDLEHRLILDRVMFPSMVAALILSLFNQPWWAGLATGVGVGALFFGLEVAGEALFKGEVLGFGDVKLAAFMGLLLGWDGGPGNGIPIVNALFLGLVLGAIAAIGVGIWRRSMKATFAYGPYLAAGALIVLYQLPEQIL
jgi:leader peptidase (prepilin peptidase)/N-methyltransferase